MGKRKLDLVEYYHGGYALPAEGITGDKNCVTLVFNRKLHPLEVMGIAARIKEDLHKEVS